MAFSELEVRKPASWSRCASESLLLLPSLDKLGRERGIDKRHGRDRPWCPRELARRHACFGGSRDQITSGRGIRRGIGVALDVEGAEDVGILIGRHGETLSAIQFMTTLIVAKKVGKSTKVLVDVEGYRSRREVSLRSLAQRVAGRVQETTNRWPSKQCHRMSGA